MLICFSTNVVAEVIIMKCKYYRYKFESNESGTTIYSANIKRDKKNLTLHQQLNKNEYDISKSVNLLLKRGQVSLHDVYMVHGSKENKSPNSRRALTMRFMPLSSKFDHEFIFDSMPSFKIDKIYPVRN